MKTKHEMILRIKGKNSKNTLTDILKNIQDTLHQLTGET